ncbi:MAG: glycosyltransferase family 4 protein [Clostridiaceae bacterium]
MKILMVNKFLYLNGGSETYIFKLGDYLKAQGHEVEYFGMEHEGRVVSNSAESYTSNMDFHSGELQKLLYPFKIIYSAEARKKIRKVLDMFQPDVVHLNNFNFQLTPSIIYEIRKYERQTKGKVRIVFTAHDSQLVCPNHLMKNPGTGENCEKCLGSKFMNCIKGKCIHGSAMRSAIGMAEGYLYKFLKTYRYIDAIVCPSQFLANKMNSNPLFRDKTIVLHNFVDDAEWKDVEKEDYILYFGRFSEEKGIRTLIDVCKSLSHIKFIFAGTGTLGKEIAAVDNIKNVGYQTGEALEMLIRKARFSIYPSEWYENCPFSVIESLKYGTPVLGADIGGIPELIEVGKTGELFKSGDAGELKKKIEILWNDRTKASAYYENCKGAKFDTISDYCVKLMKIYKG